MKHPIEKVRDALARLTKAAFGEKVAFASIPARPGHDADLVLSDAVDELERLVKQGQADWRAACDALCWAHEYHLAELPPPQRSIVELIRQRDEARRQRDVEHQNFLREQRCADERTKQAQRLLERAEAAEAALAEYQRWDADLAIAAAKAIRRNVRTELELLEARELAAARRVQLVNAETAYMDRERDYQRLKALQFDLPREVLDRALKALRWADRWMKPVHGAHGDEDSIPAAANELSKYLTEPRCGEKTAHALSPCGGLGWSACRDCGATGPCAGCADCKPEETPLERYERLATEFERDTGMLRPGKDSPAAMGETHTYEERAAAFEQWMKERKP